MAVELSTITRGSLFADLRGYTDFVEQRGAAAAAELLMRYRVLAREESGDSAARRSRPRATASTSSSFPSFSAVRGGLAITSAAGAADEPIRVGIGVHAGGDDRGVLAWITSLGLGADRPLAIGFRQRLDRCLAPESPRLGGNGVRARLVRRREEVEDVPGTDEVGAQAPRPSS